MKQLFMLGGTMGVGKTAVSRELQERLPDCVMLDGDWCWDAVPFCVTEETRRMVLQNIVFLLRQFLACSAYQNIVFCWVMHEKAIGDRILEQLDTRECRVHRLSLVCTEEALRSRLLGDIADGRRQPDVLTRSIARLPLYRQMAIETLDTSALTPAQAAQAILEIAAESPR